MLFTRQWGPVRISHFVEISGPTHDPRQLFPDLPPAELAAKLASIADWLAPDHWAPASDRLIVTYQFWILQLPDQVVVVDGGAGNGKNRPGTRMHRMDSLFLPWLNSLGLQAEDVSLVINTHLHPDHVGWNTCGPDNQPTFPKARYLLPKRDVDHFGDLHRSKPESIMSLAYADSVLPVLQSGLAETYDGVLGVDDTITIQPAPGHTPGHSVLRLRSGEQSAILCGDVYHTPLQIAFPEMNSKNDILPEQAARIRIAFTEAVAASGDLILPCHFGRPFGGRVRKAADGRYRFDPEGLQ